MFIRILKTVFIVILLFFASFFPEPLHEQFRLGTVFLLGGFLLIFYVFRKDRVSVFSLEDLPLWLFLLSFAGGLVAAQNRAAAVKTYIDIALPLFFLYYLCKLVFDSKKNIAALSRIACLFSIVVAAGALLEWFLGRNLIYEYLLDNPYYYRYLNWPFRRPMSTQFNPVILGTYLLACFPFALVLIREKRSFFRCLGVLSVILSSVVIVFTLSRGVLLGFAALVVFYLWHSRKKKAVVLVILFLIILMVSCSYSGADGLNRFGFKRMVCGSYDSIFSEYRFTRVKMAKEMLKDYPVTGVGLSHFRIRFNEYYPLKDPEIYEFMVADNMYLTILAETGVIGFAGFMIFIVTLFWKRQRFFSEAKDDDKYFVLAVFSGLTGLLVNMAAYELFYWHVPFIFFSLFCGIIAARLSKEKKSC